MEIGGSPEGQIDSGKPDVGAPDLVHMLRVDPHHPAQEECSELVPCGGMPVKQDRQCGRLGRYFFVVARNRTGEQSGGHGLRDGANDP